MKNFLKYHKLALALSVFFASLTAIATLLKMYVLALWIAAAAIIIAMGVVFVGLWALYQINFKGGLGE